MDFFLCYSQYIIKVDFIIGRVECTTIDALSLVTPLTEGEDYGIHLPIIAINEVTAKIALPSIQLEEI